MTNCEYGRTAPGKLKVAAFVFIVFSLVLSLLGTVNSDYVRNQEKYPNLFKDGAKVSFWSEYSLPVVAAGCSFLEIVNLLIHLLKRRIEYNPKIAIWDFIQHAASCVLLISAGLIYLMVTLKKGRMGCTEDNECQKMDQRLAAAGLAFFAAGACGVIAILVLITNGKTLERDGVLGSLRNRNHEVEYSSEEMLDTLEFENETYNLNESSEEHDDKDNGLISLTQQTNYMYGWGNAKNGTLGMGEMEEANIDFPTRIDFFQGKIKSVACGESHTVLLLTDGTLWSSGLNDYGQLGHGKCRTFCPERVEGLRGRKIVAVSAGHAHNLAVDKWGSLYSWGSNSHGQTGQQLEARESQNLVKRPKLVKSMATKTVVQVAAGTYHSVVLTSAGEIYTCGSNNHGQLGIGTVKGPFKNKFSVVESLLGLPTRLIVAGGYHSFVVSVSGAVFGWGKNAYGQLGVGDTQDKGKPTLLTTLGSLGVGYIAVGTEHTCFLTQDGGLFSTGLGAQGQLGHGSYSNQVLPRKILEFGTVVTQVACGKSHTLCLAQGKVYTFGQNSSGQLGLEADITTKINSPVHVGLKECKVSQIYGGGCQSIVLGDSLDIIVDTVDYREIMVDMDILSFTNDFINKLCGSLEPVDQNIMSAAEILFASLSCWNTSFLLSQNRHVPCTRENIGIDLNLAESVFSKLVNIKSDSLRELLEQQLYLEILEKLPNQLEHEETLRVFVLISLLPQFYSGSGGSTNLLPVIYADLLLALRPCMTDVVMQWLFDSPEEHLYRIISVFKRTLISVLDSVDSLEAHGNNQIRSCLNFLSRLNTLNKTEMRISYHVFSIPQLTSKVDIRKDYAEWLLNDDNDRTNTRVLRPVFLCDFPFIFDAAAKSLLLETDQVIQMHKAVTTAQTHHLLGLLIFPEFFDSAEDFQYLCFAVSRENIVTDVLHQIVRMDKDDLKKPLKVKFIGEEGVDAGGVKKEFFLLLIRELLDPKLELFRHYEETRLIWFKEEIADDMYFLIGLLCGLAIYNSIIINIPFPLALYKKLLGEKVDVSDLKELSPAEGHSMEHMLEYSEPDFEEVFCLTFETSRKVAGNVVVTPLKPGGATIPVTLQNKQEFVELYVSELFNLSVDEQFLAFKAGFERVCGSTVLQLFHALELQAMVTGNEDYDWGELERNCSYRIYTEDDNTIRLFWDVFHNSLSLEEKKQFLLFLTGSDRVPILGMEALTMYIQPLEGSDDSYLPAAHTCFNLLDLPKYKSRETLSQKLLQAIQHNEGFSMA